LAGRGVVSGCSDGPLGRSVFINASYGVSPSTSLCRSGYFIATRSD
jgi:hypothetical protein